MQSPSLVHAKRSRAPAAIGGHVSQGFEEVRTEFARNLAERGEIGAAVAAYVRGKKVVDLWGGHRTPERDLPWNEDTMVIVFSSTKGLSAMTLAIANARGWLDYDAPVARYWPEFAQNAKAAITVRQLLGHEAGLVFVDENLSLEKLRDLDYLARVLARQTPSWTPGSRHGYHAMSIGLYMQEIMRRVDPAHRTLGRFFHEEIRASSRHRFLHRLATGHCRCAPRQGQASLPSTRARRDAHDAARPHPKSALALVLAAQVAGIRRPALERASEPRGGGPGRQWRRHRPRDGAGLFGVRGGGKRARHHTGDIRAAHGASRVRACAGRNHQTACLLFARLSETGPNVAFGSRIAFQSLASSACAVSPAAYGKR